jgi:hypothetical protein
MSFTTTAEQVGDALRALENVRGKIKILVGREEVGVGGRIIKYVELC